MRLKDSGLSTQDGRSEVLKSIQNTSRLWEAGHSRERKTEHGLAEVDALMGEVKKKKPTAEYGTPQAYIHTPLFVGVCYPNMISKKAQEHLLGLGT